MSRVRWYGLAYSMPFQPSTITSEDAPRPEREASGCSRSHGGHALCQQRRSPGVRRGNRQPEAKPWHPRCGQGERGEAIATVHLRGPYVAVPELLELLKPLAVLMQGDLGEGDGHSVTGTVKGSHRVILARGPEGRRVA